MNTVRSGGYTIIEVMLVLGISAGLLMVAFLGQRGISERARFSDATQRFTTNLEQIQNEVVTGVQDNETSICGIAPVGENPDCVLFGKVVLFTPGTSNYEVRTYTAPRTKPTVLGERFPLEAEDRVIEPINEVSSIRSARRIDWNATIESTSGVSGVAFIRHGGNGRLETHAINAFSNPRVKSTYSDSTRQQAMKLVLRGDNGEKACVYINDDNRLNTIRLTHAEADPSC